MAHVDLTCETCGAAFSVRPYRATSARFCSGSCRGKWVATLPHVKARSRAPRLDMRGNTFRRGLRPANAFPKGHRPWNADLKGIHLSPESEFKPGPRAAAPVGTERLRRDKHGGHRMWVKIAQPNEWRLRAVKVWEDANGPLPRGHVVHHVDHDKLNDVLTNLEGLTRAEHAAAHREDIRRGRWGD